MKKCSFYRTIYGGVHKGAILKKTEGFCEELTDNNGNKFMMCYHKTSDGWIATERSTGLRICKDLTRAATSERVKNTYLNLMFDKMKDLQKYADMIKEAEKETKDET